MISTRKTKYKRKESLIRLSVLMVLHLVDYLLNLSITPRTPQTIAYAPNTIAPRQMISSNIIRLVSPFIDSTIEDEPHAKYKRKEIMLQISILVLKDV